MVQIKIPEIHSFQSALVRYRYLSRLQKVGIGLILASLLLFLLSGTPLLIVGIVIGLKCISHSWRNKDTLRKTIIDTWLGGSETKFVEISANLSNYIADMPAESKDNILKRESKTKTLGFKMFIRSMCILLFIAILFALTSK